MISYLEPVSGHPNDQRKEGLVDGTVRKSNHFTELGNLSAYLRLFLLPIMVNDDQKYSGVAEGT